MCLEILQHTVPHALLRGALLMKDKDKKQPKATENRETPEGSSNNASATPPSWTANPASTREVPPQALPKHRLSEMLTSSVTPATELKGTPSKPDPVQTADNMGGMDRSTRKKLTSAEKAVVNRKLTISRKDLADRTERVFYGEENADFFSNVIADIDKKVSVISKQVDSYKARGNANLAISTRVAEMKQELRAIHSDALDLVNPQRIEDINKSLREAKPEYNEIDINVVASNKVNYSYKNLLNKLNALEQEVTNALKVLPPERPSSSPTEPPKTRIQIPVRASKPRTLSSGGAPNVGTSSPAMPPPEWTQRQSS